MSHSQRFVAISFALLFSFGGGVYTLLSSHALSPVPVGNPYIDPSQDIPYPQTSFYTQPWRGWMETVPATKMLNGVGVNFQGNQQNLAQDDANLQYLASIGVHDIRVGSNWGNINGTDENSFSAQSQAYWQSIFADCKRYGITPTLILYAGEGDPEPTTTPAYKPTLVGTPHVGDSQITVTGIPASDITVHQPNTTTGSSGIQDGDSTFAHLLITNVVTNGDGSLTLTLSRPLDNPLTSPVSIQYMKYLPLYPVGTPEFDNTATGWVNYARVITGLASSAGLTNFNVEIWNELSFGSNFLNINNYYPNSAQPYPGSNGNASQLSGGNKWELANRTTQYLKQTYGSNVNVIWGYTNSCPTCGHPNERPPNTDGESYHPYGTGLNTFIGNIDSGSLAHLQEGSYVPDIQRAVPESVTNLGYDTENIIREKLAPKNREKSLPLGTTNFLHYISETGFSPGGSGKITNTRATNQLLKSKSILREYSFWLNKGLDQFDLYAAFDSGSVNDGGFNLLAEGSENAGSPVTQQSQSLGNLTKQFAGAVNPTSPRNLGVTVADITPNDTTPEYNVFPADPATGEPALHYREMFQFLPFQVSNNKFVISTYLMGWNIYSPPPAMSFEVDITNVDGTKATASYYDPITDQSQPITVVSRTNNDIVLDLASVDYPRTITIDDSGNNPPPTDTTPPSSTISSGPASSTNSRSAVFSFSGTDDVTPGNNISFQCQLDNQAYTACTSPTTYGGLSVGSHTFRVKGTDVAGNTETTPASQTWTVTPPPGPTGDLDGDSHVTAHDMSILIAHYGSHYPEAEFDGVTIVEAHDLSLLIANYGK